MEYTKQEIKLEPKEEISYDEVINEKSNKTHPLKSEENIFIPMPMKTEDVIKTEDNPVKAEISDANSFNIAIKGHSKVELSENDFKTDSIKSEDLKTLVIKLERIDEKFCLDGLKFRKEDNSYTNEDIYILPTNRPDEADESDNYSDIEESNVDNSFTELNLNMGVEESHSWTGSTVKADETDNYSDVEESNIDKSFTQLNLNMGVEDSHSRTGSTAKVKKKYDRPLKYICTFCDKGFISITALRDHTRVHTGEQPYPCPFCNKRSRTKSFLKRHLQLHIGKRYKCADCDKRFQDVCSLKVHMRTHTGDKPFICSKCSRAFVSKDLLKKHLKTKGHSSNVVVKRNDSYGCICSICNKNFNQKFELSRHIQSVHLKLESFPCRICGMVSFTQSNRNKHERLHKNEFSFLCHECNMGFKERGGLLRHRNTVHSEAKPFSCNLCNASFKLSSNLKIHYEVHHTEKDPNKYVCDVCKMGFYRLVYLKRHQKIHTGSDKTLTCDECGIKCRSKTDMARHVVTHVGGGNKPFKCDKCGMAFSRRGKMLRHQLVHSDEKPYKCDLCTKAYKDSGSLRIHKDSFHLKRTFICNECGFISTCERSLKRHVRLQLCKN